MREISIDELQVGFCLSKDIYNDLGNIILAQGTEIQMRHIEYFRSHGIENVFLDDIDDDNMRREGVRITTSDRYIELNSSYAQVLDRFKTLYLQIQNRSYELDFKELEDDIKPLVNTAISDNDILTSMRMLNFNESYHFTHAVNVSMFASMLGKWLGLSLNDIYSVAMAGLLHDIGKTQVPQELLFKTTALETYELSSVKDHAVLGYEILKNHPDIPREVLAAVLFHHERSDGSGYPKGLLEDQTPFLARIIGVVDVFDAITSDRFYKKAVSSFKAFNIMKDESFRGLDPKITDVFMSNIASFFINNRVKLNDGRVGEVIYVNKFALNRPLIKIGEDFVDLSSDYSLDIDEVINKG